MTQHNIKNVNEAISTGSAKGASLQADSSISASRQSHPQNNNSGSGDLSTSHSKFDRTISGVSSKVSLDLNSPNSVSCVTNTVCE